MKKKGNNIKRVIRKKIEYRQKLISTKKIKTVERNTVYNKPEVKPIVPEPVIEQPKVYKPKNQPKEQSKPKVNINDMNERMRRRLGNSYPVNVDLVIRNNQKNIIYEKNKIFELLNSDVYLSNSFNILFLISNYERYDMLMQLLNEINNINLENINVDYMIFDDCSPYEIEKNVIVNSNHRGKFEYWRTFNEMFNFSKKEEYDLYVFTPNDFLNYDFDKLINLALKLKNIKYFCNIINDGRKISWIKKDPYNINDIVDRIYFTDCGFFTNRKTLETLEFKIYPVIRKKNQSNNVSSGVGKQLSERLFKLNIPILNPVKSLAYHGNHDSLMNPYERQINKLISI